MGLDVRKLVLGVACQVIVKPSCSATETSWNSEILLITRLSVVCLIDLILYVPVNNFSVWSCLPGLKQYYARVNVSCSRTQRSDADEA